MILLLASGQKASRSIVTRVAYHPESTQMSVCLGGQFAPKQKRRRTQGRAEASILLPGGGYPAAPLPYLAHQEQSCHPL